MHNANISYNTYLYLSHNNAIQTLPVLFIIKATVNEHSGEYYCDLTDKQICSATGLSFNTIRRYLDILEDICLIKRIKINRGEKTWRKIICQDGLICKSICDTYDMFDFQRQIYTQKSISDKNYTPLRREVS